MNFFDVYKIKGGKIRLMDVINDHMTPTSQMPGPPIDLKSVVSTVKRLDLNSLDLENIQLICMSLYNCENLKFDDICKLFSETLSTLKMKLIIKDELCLSLLLTLTGISISVHFPRFSIQQGISDVIWRRNSHELCQKTSNLILSASDLNFKSDGKLERYFVGFLNAINVIYFSAVIFIVSIIRNKSVKVEDTRFYLYFTSYYLCAIGDVCRYINELPDPEIFVDFYILSTHIWSRYSRPYQCLALHYLKKEMLYEATYYYSRSFLSMTGQERFTVAKQDLPEIYGSISNKAKLWDEKFKLFKFKKFTRFSDLRHQDLYIFVIGGSTYMISVDKEKTPTLIKDFDRSSISLTPVCLSSFRKDFYKIVFNNFVFSFLLMNFKLIYRTDLDEFPILHEKWEAQFRCLQKFDEFYIAQTFESFPTFAIIMIYTLECIFYGTEAPYGSMDNSCASYIFKLFMSFSRFVVELIQAKNSEGLRIPLLKYLSLFMRSLHHYSKNDRLASCVNNEVRCGNVLFLIYLYNYLVKLGYKSIEVELSYFKILGSCALKISDDSLCWNNLDLHDNRCQFQDYAGYILWVSEYLTGSSFFPFKVEEEICTFDYSSFSSRNVEVFPNFEDFIKPLTCIHDDRIKIFLYDYALHFTREELCVNVIKYICPDTNTFLTNKSCILKNELYHRFDVLLPTVVIKELVGLSSNKTNKNSETLAQCATDAYNQLKPSITGPSNVKILTTQGKVANFNETFVIVHDVGTKYDDVILDSLIGFESAINEPLSNKKRKISFPSVLFISNDHLFRLKVLNAGIPTVDTKTFREISVLISAER
ncbi:hypothetical protein RF11_03194 [Thelohanellus kitauei]|uniref:PIN domain-containing protein n=1 Tax=Thelohanellus kitauei TaxID=669202 RepID=A0A0C2MZK8_THEKT|nr:hypothetical protein RF11_03194 [Thelohanellus kitauei]